MHKEVLRHFDQAYLAIAALIIFLCCFVAYSFWTFRKNSGHIYQAISQLPLEESTLMKGDRHERS